MDNDKRYVKKSELNIVCATMLMFIGWGFYSIETLFCYICVSIGVLAMFYGLHLKDKESKSNEEIREK